MKQKKNKVIAKRVKNFEECKEAGNYWITSSKGNDGGRRRIQFLCPCGCGILCGITVRDDLQQMTNCWGWDGNLDSPTVTPSININDGHWHGYLINGIFCPC